MMQWSIVLALVMVLGLLIPDDQSSNEWRMKQNKKFWVIAHQGSLMNWPSNTMFAYHNSVHMGADVLELDVHMSKDGVLMVHHDDTTFRQCSNDTENRGGKIKDLTVEEIKKLDCGYGWNSKTRYCSIGARTGTFPYRGIGIKMPTLKEVLEAFPKIPVNIEMKDYNLYEPLCDMLKQHSAPAIVVSFDEIATMKFQQRCPMVGVAPAEKSIIKFLAAAYLFSESSVRFGFQALQIPLYAFDWLPILTSRVIAAAHNKGILIHPWTINEISEMKNLIRHNIDGIMTDRIDLLMHVISESTTVISEDKMVESVQTGSGCSEYGKTVLQSSAGCEYLSQMKLIE